MNGDDAFRERRLPLPRADHEVGAPGDGSSACGHGVQRLLDGGCGDVRRSHRAAWAAIQMRSAVIGSSRTRAPITWAIAFAIAPGVGTVGGSPTPFDPRGPPFCAGVSIQSMSIRGASAEVTSL